MRIHGVPLRPGVSAVRCVPKAVALLQDLEGAVLGRSSPTCPT
jgi:hypothetical protein